ncbi:MAG: IS4 family transposase [Bacteroidia bacterium]|nr:IS4 family transposase [Bacteroidia bacterium]
MKIAETAPTVSAFVQRRKLIKASFFQVFFHHTAAVFSRRFAAKTWHGLRLMAIDGTGLRIPDEWGLGEHFGWHQNQHRDVPSTRWLVCLDLLNHLLDEVELHPRSQDEKSLAAPLVARWSPSTLCIYDRGFGSYAFPWLHQHHGSHCLIRLKTTFSPIVIDFLAAGHAEQIVHTPLSERAVRSLRKMGYEVNRTPELTYRLIRVELPTGETEVLMTTLLDTQAFPRKYFGQLYSLRWGVESAIFVLKSFFQAAVFSAYSLPAVEQDLWALFALYNIQSMCLRAKEKALAKINSLRHFTYPINRNVGIGLIKRFAPPLFLDEVKQWIARIPVLLDELIRHLQPQRPRPSRPRIRRLLRGTERHRFEFNDKSRL